MAPARWSAIGSLRSRVIALGALLLGLSLLGGLLLYRALVTETCAELPREDLSLHEMAQLRRRLESYRREPSVPLVLSARETSFLVREKFEIQAWLEIEGPELHLETRLPQDGRCLNVTFRGDLGVTSRVAHIVPTSLRFGALDVSWLVRGRQMEVPYAIAVAPGPGAEDLFSHLVSMQIEDGEVVVQVDDPGWIW